MTLQSVIKFVVARWDEVYLKVYTLKVKFCLFYINELNENDGNIETDFHHYDTWHYLNIIKEFTSTLVIDFKQCKPLKENINLKLRKNTCKAWVYNLEKC